MGGYDLSSASKTACILRLVNFFMLLDYKFEKKKTHRKKCIAELNFPARKKGYLFRVKKKKPLANANIFA